MSLSSKRISMDEKNGFAEARPVTPPPVYPEPEVIAKEEMIETRPKLPEASSSQSAQSEPSALPAIQQHEYALVPEEPRRHYNFDLSIPSVIKGIEEGMRSRGTTQYAWHRMRLAIRGTSVFFVLLAVFLLVGQGRHGWDKSDYWYTQFWSVTMASVVPISIAINILELLIIGMNGRGIRPTTQAVLDMLVVIALLAAGGYDISQKGAVSHNAYSDKDVDVFLAASSFEIIAAVFQLACAVFGGVAIMRLRQERM